MVREFTGCCSERREQSEKREKKKGKKWKLMHATHLHIHIGFELTLIVIITCMVIPNDESFILLSNKNKFMYEEISLFHSFPLCFLSLVSSNVRECEWDTHYVVLMLQICSPSDTTKRIQTRSSCPLPQKFFIVAGYGVVYLWPERRRS